MNLTNFQFLTGNLGKDPELKRFDNGGVICNFSLATNETWKDKDGNKQSEVTWHNCVANGKTAEMIEQYFKKGSLITVSGSKKVRKWDKDGVNQYEHFTRVDNFTFPPTEKKEASQATESWPPDEDIF